LALGSASTTPFNLAKAYGAFATYGYRFEPRVIRSIDQEGIGTVFSARPVVYEENSDMVASDVRASERIISEQTAYIITNMLTDAVQNGTGWRVKALKRPVAGKTGTSNDSRDAWFVGYTPKFLCSVWVGFDDMKPLGKSEVGGSAACPIFVNFMYSLLSDNPAMDFRVPEGIVFAQIDTKTGKLTSSSGSTRYECFKEGTLPPEGKTTGPLLKEVY
jgi:penicillin-binding protein 1A